MLVMKLQPEEIEIVAKWAAVVFTVGFIGYFGRHLSKLIIARLHKKEENEKSENEVKIKSKYDYKLEKKKLKLEKKRLKLEKEKLKKNED